MLLLTLASDDLMMMEWYAVESEDSNPMSIPMGWMSVVCSRCVPTRNPVMIMAHEVSVRWEREEEEDGRRV